MSGFSLEQQTQVSLDEVLVFTKRRLDQLSAHPSRRLGYVSGIVTSKGQEHIGRHLERLAEYSGRLADTHGFPMFSAAEIFDLPLLDRMRSQGIGAQQFIEFWRQVLGSGYVTDVFMTPEWQVSLGARDEHETAKILKLVIHYL